MAQNTSPIFILTPDTTTVVVDASSSLRDGSGSLFTLFAAGPSGSRVDSVTWTSAQSSSYAASSAMVGRVFITDTAGLNPRLLQEVAIATVTPSATVIGAQAIINFTNGLLMNSGSLLRVNQSVYAGVQDRMAVVARGGDY